MFELDEDELAVHGHSLEVVVVRQDEIGVELHAAFGEAAEGSDDFVALEQAHDGS
ncbi:hypothetical protein [Streptomyces sp. NRRL F-2799]|uniref:hypothetical protein n=1 Tax=Streptomyces sp. NRRL F-2799 TaxID=1463844 RepID=UPI001F3A4BE3|nr:hypothetical protein [Streptomyces sp. NRRL F-2799]